MPEADKAGERYQADTPQAAPGFFLKGSHQLDWGMKNRLARVFNPASGHTVMLAVDHGYFQGPTSGLERIDLSIVPLLPQCDALFCTRGILRSVIPADCQKPMVLRASGGPSILREELSDEQVSRVVRAGYLVPANLSIANSEDFLQPNRLPHHAAVFNTAARTIVVPPLVPDFNALEAAVATSLNEMLTTPVIEDLGQLTAQIDAESAQVLSPQPTESPSDGSSSSGSSSPSSSPSG